MRLIIKLLISAVAAWIVGLAVITGILFFANGGADFSVTDIAGFGAMVIIGSAMMMLLFYVPSLYWLKRRLQGCQPGWWFPVVCAVVLNMPIYLLLGILVGRKMAASEAMVFILTFFFIGTVFGLGFVWSQPAADRM